MAKSDRHECETCIYFRLSAAPPLGTCGFDPPTIFWDVVAAAPRTEFPTVSTTTLGCSKWRPSGDFTGVP